MNLLYSADNGAPFTMTKKGGDSGDVCLLVLLT